MAKIQLFQHYTKRFSQIDHLTNKLYHQEDSYALRRYKIAQLSINEAHTLLQNIEKKFYKFHEKGSSCIWFQNQLRLFIWTLICYMELHKKHIRQFTSSDWQFFSEVFYSKTPMLFQYQAKISLDYSLCLRKWSIEQDSLLMKIILGTSKIKWNQIAKFLFESSSGQFIRTSKQCRQRWLNHLDPSKTKLTWSLEQCKLLLQNVIQKGKKWASLVKNMNGRRSQHSIKNKYNSMVIKQKKINSELTQRQLCEVLLQKINTILSTKSYSQEDERIFADSIKFLGQEEENKIMGSNLNVSDEHLLQKSNISLDKSQETRQNGQMKYTLNFDDLLIDNNSQKQTGPISMLQKLRSTKNRKKAKDYIQIQCPNENIMIEEQSDNSLLYLEDLKLVIRESQLDR